jgi:hypothetical protein
VATHGRAFWILDDLSPVQQWQDSIKNEDVHLFTPRAANHTAFPGRFFGPTGSAGQNPPAGAVISYYLKTEIKKPEKKAGDAPAAAEKKDAAPVKIEILDEAGKVVRTYPSKNPPPEGEEGGFQRARGDGIPTEAGINRFVWDLHYEGAARIANSPLWGGGTDGPVALPGKYQVRLTVNGKSETAPFEIVPDPRLKVTQDDLKKQFDLMSAILGKVTQVHDAIGQMRDVRAQITALNKRLEAEKFANAKAVADAGAALDKKMTVVEEALIQTKAKSGQDVLNYPIRLNNLLVALGGVVSSADASPTKQDYELWEELKQQSDAELAKWDEIKKTDLAQFNALVKQHDVPLIGVLPGKGSE